MSLKVTKMHFYRLCDAKSWGALHLPLGWAFSKRTGHVNPGTQFANPAQGLDSQIGKVLQGLDPSGLCVNCSSAVS